MELKYCDRCGTPVKAEQDAEDFLAEFVCEECSHRESDKRNSSSGSKLQIVDSPPPRPAKEELEKSLEFFSSNTVMVKKNKMAEKSSHSAKKKTFRDPTTRSPEEAPNLSAPEDPLDLFSTQTLTLKRQNRDSHPEDPGDSVLLIDSAGMGSSAPAQTATRIQLRCVHCQKVLVIRPVQKASKMVCPGCNKKMYISDSSRLSKSPPKREQNATVSGNTMIAQLERPANDEDQAPIPSSLSGLESLSELVRESSDSTLEPKTTGGETISAVTTPPQAATISNDHLFTEPFDSGPELNPSPSGSAPLTTPEAPDLVIDNSDKSALDHGLSLDDFTTGDKTKACQKKPQEARPSVTDTGTTGHRKTAEHFDLRGVVLALCVGALISLPFFTAAYLTRLETGTHDHKSAVENPLVDQMRSLGTTVRDGFKQLLGNR